MSHRGTPAIVCYARWVVESGGAETNLGLEMNDTFLSLLYFYPKQSRPMSHICFHANLLKSYFKIRYGTNITWWTTGIFVLQSDISNKYPVMWGLLPGLCTWSYDLLAISENKSYCSTLIQRSLCTSSPHCVHISEPPTLYSLCVCVCSPCPHKA